VDRQTVTASTIFRYTSATRFAPVSTDAPHFPRHFPTRRWPPAKACAKITTDFVAQRKHVARRTGIRGETYAYWYLRRHGYIFVARITPRAA